MGMANTSASVTTMGSDNIAHIVPDGMRRGGRGLEATGEAAIGSMYALPPRPTYTFIVT